MSIRKANKCRRRVYANTIDPFIPEFWANESIAVLEEEMMFGGLVNRDFNNELASFGDTVHTRKPGEFVAKRKTRADAVTDQDVTATDVSVVLNQWVHVSFVIKDDERTMAFQDLVSTYIRPAMSANARLLDQCIAGQAYQFLTNSVGSLGGLTSSNAQSNIINARAKMNATNAHQSGRNLVVGPNTEAEFLKTDLFVSAERVGTTAALSDAWIGRKFGFDVRSSMNLPAVVGPTLATATTTTAAAAVGAANVAITSAVGKGVYCTIAGEGTPMRSTTNTTTFTPTRAFKNGCASGAAVQPCAVGAVTAAYASGYAKYINVDGTGVPVVGQLVSFLDGDSTATGTLRTPEYCIVQVLDGGSSTYDILLDRPLETALANNDVVCYGPAGEYNFAFHRDAVTLVNRPLQLPVAGVGARSAFAEYNGLSMRAVITYDGANQGHRVVLDSLFGVKTLDTDLGCVLLG